MSMFKIYSYCNVFVSYKHLYAACYAFRLFEYLDSIVEFIIIIPTDFTIL